MFECESCGNIYKDRWEACPACGGKIREKGSNEVPIIEKTNEELKVPEKGESRFLQKMPSIDDIFGETRIPPTPSPDDKTIHETKIRQAPLDSIFTFEEPKPKVRKVKKVKTPKKTKPSFSFCPYCGKKLPPPVRGEWSFCLYCGMKLR